MDRTQIVLLAIAVALVLASFQLAGPAPQAPAEADRTRPEVQESPGPIAARRDAAAGEGRSSGPDAAFEEAPEVSVVELSNGSLRFSLSNEGGRITSLTLDEYSARVDTPGVPVQLGTDQEDGLLAISLEGDVRGVGERRFRVEERTDRLWQGRLRTADGVEVVQRVELDREGYGGWLSVVVENKSDRSIATGFDVDVFGRAEEEPGGLQNMSVAAFSDADGLIVEPLKGIEEGGFFRSGGPRSEVVEGALQWGGVQTQYFLVAVVPEGSGFTGTLASVGADTGRARVSYPSRQIQPQQYIDRRYRLYLGPKIEENVAAVDPRLEPALQVGYAWVRPLAQFFAGVLNWLYENTIPNYGAAIVIITVLLRVIMYPLTQKSMQSMRRMSVLAPQLKEVQEKYKGDQQRMQQELLELYKRTGVNPFAAMGGGCLPILLQAPFMIALYYSLQGMIELRHAPFVLWIDDLSAPEELAKVFGVSIRPLALGMGGAMFLQTYLQPASNDAQAQQQRQMMLMMSLVFVVMFYSFPSGLVLYWLVSTLLGIVQQVLVNRSLPGPGAEAKQGAT